MTVARIVLPVLMSVALGIALNRLPADRAAAPVQAGGGCGHACKHEAPRGIIAASGSALRQLLPYYLAGLAVVSVLQAFLPADLMARHGRGAWAYAVSLLTAVPLYVCDGAEVPLTAALLKLGIGPGPAFTFLLASVGTCLPTILMAPQIVGLRATLLYVSSSIALALGGGLLFGAPA